jgi:glycosyltransferase involved in cell wall biosynthesis
LDACLQAVARQTVTPDEVIVVDNNSTDDSLAIACSFSFVRVIKENRQGVAYARDCGFDAVKSDIIARIDADTIIAQNWVETLQQLFKDQQLDVVTGKMTYHDVAAASLVNAVDLVIRRWMAKVLAKDIAMFGEVYELRCVMNVAYTKTMILPFMLVNITIAYNLMSAC